MTRFTGDICDKHPEQAGLRYRANRVCVICHRDRGRARRELINPTFQRGEKVTGRTCKKHPELEGLRYANGRTCIGCQQDRSHGYQHLDDARARLTDARAIIEEAWRLLDGQDPKTAEWHLAASAYLNEVRQ